MNKTLVVLLFICVSGLIYNVVSSKQKYENLEGMMDLKNQKDSKDFAMLQGFLDKENRTSSELYKDALSRWGAKNQQDSEVIETIHLFMKSAELGHPNAQFIVAQLHMNSQYLIPNYSEAVNWLEKAGKQGMSMADLHLGIMYALGNGIVKDSEKGMRYLGRAAQNNQNYALDIFNPIVEEVKSGKINDGKFEKFLDKTMDYSEKHYRDAWYSEKVNVTPIMETEK